MSKTLHWLQSLTNQIPRNHLNHPPTARLPRWGSLRFLLPKGLGLPFRGSLEFPEADTNKTDRNKTELNDTGSSPSSQPPATPRRRPKVDRKGQLEAYRTILRENISYDILLRDYGCDPKLIDGYVELMAEVCSSTRETVRVNQEELPTELVRNRFLHLDMTHIAYVQDYLSKNTTPVGNIRAYTLSVLYNAPTTMGQYYASQVSHDMAQGFPPGRPPT